MPREITIVENQFKSSGPQPNKLQVAEKGLWYIDQVDLKVYKLGWVTGEIPFEDQTDTEHSSGITLRGRHLWIASSCELKLAKPGLEAGETIGKYDSPGAEVTASREGIEGAQVTRLYRLEWIDRMLYVVASPLQIVHIIDLEIWKEAHQFRTPGFLNHGLA